MINQVDDTGDKRPPFNGSNPEHSKMNLEREKAVLRDQLAECFYSLSEELLETRRRLEILEESARNQANSLQAKTGEIISQSFKTWHAPFSLPFKLVKFWWNEILLVAPPSLGGKSYGKVIGAYEQGGFDAVDQLLAPRKYTPFIRANAWTALARHFQRKDMKSEMVIAATLACEIDPKAFRHKWRALKMNEAGKPGQADIILSSLPASCGFSDTEEKTRKEIMLEAVLEKAAGNHSLLWKRLCENSRESEQDLAEDNLAKTCIAEGAEAVIALLEERFASSPEYLALRLGTTARSVLGECPEVSFELAKRAATISPRSENIRFLFQAAQKAGRLIDACAAIDAYGASLSPKNGELSRVTLENMRCSQLYELELLERAATTAPISKNFKKKRVCYVLHNSLPWSSGGYATRSQGVAKGLKALGYEVLAITRPGYPLDLVAGLSEAEISPEPDIVDGIYYYRLKEPRRTGLSSRDYALESARALEALFEELRPEVVIAASNHTSALPTLIACRRLGIPIIYEVRGLLEITHFSRERAYGNTPSFHVHRILETEICKMADHVITLTGGLKNELVARGVAPEHIALAPNACDPGRFTPREPEESLAARLNLPSDTVVIGYVGTFVIYEGLPDLARACAILKKKGVNFRLLLVGNENASGNERGAITAEIMRIAEKGGFSDWLIMPGRVPHDEVEKYYSLIDIAPFPRKPWPVCEIVSPMKPLEAMSMGKAILVSSVQALAEMARDGQTGLIFEKGNIDDLALKLEELARDRDKRLALGSNARKFIESERTWRGICGVFDEKIRAVVQNNHAPE